MFHFLWICRCHLYIFILCGDIPAIAIYGAEISACVTTFACFPLYEIFQDVARSLATIKELENLVEYVNGNDEIDFVAIGGDTIQGTQTKSTSLGFYKKAFTPFLKCNKPVFIVPGNHDDNSIWDLVINAEASTNHLSTEELCNIFYNHLPKAGAKFDEKIPAYIIITMTTL